MLFYPSQTHKNYTNDANNFFCFSEGSSKIDEDDDVVEMYQDPSTVSPSTTATRKRKLSEEAAGNVKKARHAEEDIIIL
jgi:hypothetical protein